MGTWVDKVNGDTVDATTEWNPIQNEIENLQTAGSETASASTDQMAKAVTNISANADYYTDGGAADAYVLSVIAPNKAPTAYRTGMRVRFRTSNANTGASTINVASLGVKNIKKQDGSSDPDAADISDARENILAYDGTVFRLITELNDASTTLKGIVELATSAEITTGTDATRAVTPAGLAGSNQAAMTLLETQTASASATIDFTTGIDSTYTKYIIEITNLVPATDDVIANMLISEDAGSSWKTGAADYGFAVQGRDSGGTAMEYTDTDAATMSMSDDGATVKVSSDAGASYECTIEVSNPASTSVNKIFRYRFAYKTTSASNIVVYGDGSGMYKGTTNAINGIRILMSSGNITSGTFKLYGIK